MIENVTDSLQNIKHSGPDSNSGLLCDDGWITCDFTSFPTAFQSYQDDERLTMEGCVQGTPFTVEKISPRAGIELGPLASV